MTIAMKPELLAGVSTTCITGDQLVYVADSSNIEARMLAWLAGQNNLVELFANDGDAYSAFASILFGFPVNKDDNPHERFIGKVCIAEGSLVLTDVGLVPIEKVTLDHKVWDGVNWVQHDGVVYQGFKKVITYDGLTATPDHRVYTQGRSDPIQIGDAASSLDRLVRSESGGQAVRVGDSYLPAHRPQQRLPHGANQMHRLRSGKTNQPGQSQVREDLWVPNLLAEAVELVHRAWETLRCLDRAVHFAKESSLSTLRGARDYLQLCVEGGVCTLRRAALAAPGLQRRGNRPQGQQRELRTGQPTSRATGRELSQSRRVGTDPLAGADGTVGRVPEPVCLHPDTPVRQTGANGGADHRAGLAVGTREAQGLDATPRKAHVYDILNAGPNRRFTVSGVLVANCVLGLGYGMGWAKFKDTLAAGALGGPPVYFTEAEARNAVNTYRAANAMITAYWDQATIAIADMYLGNTRQWGPLTIQKNCIVMPNGMALQYPGLRPRVVKNEFDEDVNDGWEYWEGDFWKKLYGGLLTENITQAMSRIVLFHQMLRINKEVFVPAGGRVVLNVHDEIIGVGPSYGARYLGIAQKVKNGQPVFKNDKPVMDEVWDRTEGADHLFAQMQQVMREPLWWCPDLPLASDGGFSFEYSK